MCKNGIIVEGNSGFFYSGTFELRNDQITATIRVQNDNPLIPLIGRRKWRSSPGLNKRAATSSNKSPLSEVKIVGRGSAHPTIRGRDHG